MAALGCLECSPLLLVSVDVDAVVWATSESRVNLPVGRLG